MGVAAVALRAAVATRPSGLVPALALRPAVGLAAGLAYGVASGHLLAGVTLAAGAIPVGVASLVGRFKAPLLMLLLTCAATGLSTFVGSLTSHASVFLNVPLLAVWGFAAGLAVALGPVPAVVATQAVVAYVVFGRFPLAAGAAADQGLLVAAGGLVQVALVGAVRRRGRFRTERRAVAAAYDALAGLATAPDASGSALPAAEATDEARAVLARSWAGPGSTAREVFGELVDQAARTRVDLVALAAARTRLAAAGADDPVAEVDGFRRAAAAALTAVARAAAAGAHLPPLDLTVPADGAVDGAVDSAVPPDGAVPPAAYPTWWFARSRMAAVAGQLRAVAGLTVPRDRHHSRGRPTPPQELRSALQVLRAHLDPSSATFRHATRLAVAMPVGEVLAHLLTDRRGYWVPLTILIVLKPDFATSTSRGVARVGGTAVGVALASLIADGLDPRGWGLVVAVGLLAWAMLATLSWNYGVFAVFNAALVVFLISTADPQPTTIAADRLLETAIGGTLAFVAFLAWPAWSGSQLRPAVAGLLRAQAAYVGACLEALAADHADGESARDDARRAGDRARVARTDAETVLLRVDAEPAARRGDPDTARRLVAACGRLVRAGHELAGLSGDGRPPLPALRPLRADLVAGLDALASTVAAGTGIGAGVPDLRAAYDRAEAALSAGDPDRAEGARRAVALAACDELVDAVDAARDVLAPAPVAATV